MKTTVDIPDQVLQDAMRFTRAQTKREAILTAMEEFNQRHAQADLIKYFGQFDSLMTNADIERAELNDASPWGDLPRTPGKAR